MLGRWLTRRGRRATYKHGGKGSLGSGGSADRRESWWASDREELSSPTDYRGVDASHERNGFLEWNSSMCKDSTS